MSVFSDLLKNYIHEKKVKIMALAQYCNLERSTVYKFINGKRSSRRRLLPPTSHTTGHAVPHPAVQLT